MQNQLTLPFLTFCLLFCLSFSFATAQIGPNLGQTDRWMKGATAAMEREDYQTANSIFRDLIDSGQPLPEEMPYFFAETLYQLKQYDNSRNFLNKYLELTGFTGSHYQGAQELKKKLEVHLSAIAACQLCDRRGYRYTVCSTCEGNKKVEQACTYCKAKGVVGCSRCNGTGMITKVNIFNIVEYFECERCDGKGRLTCPECQGSLKTVSDCRTCEGTGKLVSEELCDHQEQPHTH